MNNIMELCERIDIPKEVTAQVRDFDAQTDYTPVEAAMEKLFHRASWDEGLGEIKAYLGQDPQGIKMLACMLRCGLKTWENYVKQGIPEQIFVDTMKCFSRFMGEHKEGYGNYAFDREWWTSRQIAGQLLRIGELEYEMRPDQQINIIDLHIPSDARLERDSLLESLHRAREFFKEKYPVYGSAKMRCCSWLLSPTLKELLPKGSRILGFQELFDIETVGIAEDSEYITWVFKRPDIAFEDLPENTSLQREMKKYLLSGRKMVDAIGIIKNDGQQGMR
ncbi:hypothetical protein D7V94_06355 [Parablautia intestinalis]|uniref:GNAT-like C-terminal domain-containing protein n=1 Tax=Parablautia intestinalis TaxID=2320100 RepID=A0A3A9AXL0_9FIRM|nr:acyltransferase domain-containing protein [Parablautia intestinalis]RKI92303.1 hypothetical protein D7V94_06355 [Parablautia intestinalis]